MNRSIRPVEFFICCRGVHSLGMRCGAMQWCKTSGRGVQANATALCGQRAVDLASATVK